MMVGRKYHDKLVEKRIDGEETHDLKHTCPCQYYSVDKVAYQQSL